MFYDARIPNMRKAHFFKLLQGFVIDIIEFPAAVFFYRAIVFITRIAIAKQARQ